METEDKAVATKGMKCYGRNITSRIWKLNNNFTLSCCSLLGGLLWGMQMNRGIVREGFLECSRPWSWRTKWSWPGRDDASGFYDFVTGGMLVPHLPLTWLQWGQVQKLCIKQGTNMTRSEKTQPCLAQGRPPPTIKSTTIPSAKLWLIPGQVRWVVHPHMCHRRSRQEAAVSPPHSAPGAGFPTA